MDNTCFCIECSKKVSYDLRKRHTKSSVRGVSFNYDELFVICKECGNELYVPEINDINVECRENAFRKVFENKFVDNLMR